jgi:hypothetical protein
MSGLPYRVPAATQWDGRGLGATEPQRACLPYRPRTRISVPRWAGALPEPKRSGGGGAPRFPPEGETGKGEIPIPCCRRPIAHAARSRLWPSGLAPVRTFGWGAGKLSGANAPPRADRTAPPPFHPVARTPSHCIPPACSASASFRSATRGCPAQSCCPDSPAVRAGSRTPTPDPYAASAQTRSLSPPLSP